MATASSNSSVSRPSQWSWYLQEPRSTIYDPHGDVLLVLSKTIAPSDSDPNAETPTTKKGKDAQRETPAGQHHGSSPAEALTAQNIQEIEVKVSSKHLSLASRVFHTMFNGKFREGVAPEVDQLTRVPLPEDDADAMMILLGIIHGLNRSVPLEVERTLFLAIVVLIDKYELQEATGVYTNLWFSELWWKREIRAVCLADWIFTCWVLRKPLEYLQLTKSAILGCTSRFDENGLPFPPTIPAKIESSRLSVIESMLTYLNETLGRYLGEKQQCPRDAKCDALVFGDLAKKLKIKGLYPVPEAAALDISINVLFAQILTLEVRSLCEINATPKPPPHYGGLMPDPPSCGVRKGLESKMSLLGCLVCGLTLPPFTP
ncbi:uncharacterized protein Z520_05635 [Fonsecaea multimorphosa CBS 102226]|uniref:BTB domain-containing protein n=1 Tax=Fonsecaea multimorphosa CBS 102226 TaxID=1442371 RepID=A0A0D2K5B3_9EURO|nr:uncharacterized protein Z520_05635 [Fonsecaea multimorphosa CBS 102226]KIX98334.1 hypothetical protein Z520_05635 [Fonsecaea multimorphosa CBS 102226]OAL24529.1 hypothetical protein AYO22_05318 [Fonsecaea multimorphosa]